MSDPQIRIPFGRLVSWGSVSFATGRSKMISGWKMSTAGSHGAVLGQHAAFDRFGKTIVPVEFVYTWEYVLRGTSTVDEIQTWMDNFLLKYLSSQVDTLTVATFGGTAADHQVSGLARLEEISETGGNPTWKQLNLTFFTTGLSG